MRLFNGITGHATSGRKGTAWRKATASAAMVLGLATAGTTLAAGTASASVWNPNVTVVGHVSACGARSVATGVQYGGSNGDRGFVRVDRNGWYAIGLHRVGGWRGEFIGGRVFCTGRPPVSFGYGVDRPWRGVTVFRDIR